MVVFQKIHIKDYKSVRDVTLEYTQGVWHVIGENKDSTFSSNGSGKSTILEAIQQCLFNKTTNNISIEDTGFRTTKSLQPYEITLDFRIASSSYRVINNRKTMKISIVKDGVDLMIKAIPKALEKVQEIIGMDFTTFVTLTFISHKTIIDLVDNFSSSNLMKILLDFNAIAGTEKSMKARVKELVQHKAILLQQEKALQDNLSILSQFVYVDPTPLKQKVVEYSAHKDKYHNEMLKFRDKDTYEQRISTLERDIKKAGVSQILCPKCSTSIPTYKSTDEIAEMQLEIHTLREKIEALSLGSLDYVEGRFKEFNNKLIEVQQALNSVETRNHIYEENKQHTDALNSDLLKVKNELDTLNFEHSVLVASLDVIKSGDTHAALLSSFTSAFNSNLSYYSSFIKIPYVTLTAAVNKTSIKFITYDTRFNQNVSMDTLSGGEITRLRLIILLSMLKTIKTLTNVSTNILVFDESLDTLDASVAEDLAMLFDHLTTIDQKFIALVSHGQQLDKIRFTGDITVTKYKGVTNMEVSNG